MNYTVYYLHYDQDSFSDFLNVNLKSQYYIGMDIIAQTILTWGWICNIDLLILER